MCSKPRHQENLLELLRTKFFHPIFANFAVRATDKHNIAKVFEIKPLSRKALTLWSWSRRWGPKWKAHFAQYFLCFLLLMYNTHGLKQDKLQSCWQVYFSSSSSQRTTAPVQVTTHPDLSASLPTYSGDGSILKSGNELKTWLRGSLQHYSPSLRENFVVQPLIGKPPSAFNAQRGKRSGKRS